MTYYLPPEWAPQSGVMLTWPHADSDWAPFLPTVETEFVAIAKAIVARESLLISCASSDHRSHIQTQLTQAAISLSKIHFFIVPSDDTWVRDHGPLTVFDSAQKLFLLDFIFNGWGNKFSAQQDNCITHTLYQQNAFPTCQHRTMPYVLEGGSIDVDGRGTLITTSRCLLAPTRNPTLTRADTERYLREWFGIDRVLWIENGYLAGDDTDSHIDTLVRFTDPQTLCYVRCDDPHDEHFAALQAMEAELQAFKQINDRPYRLIPLPWPRACFSATGERLPATYANFLIINEAVLVPTYDDPADLRALAQLQTCFPDREIIGIPCRTLIEQHGSLHCVTMQLPDGVLSPAPAPV